MTRETRQKNAILRNLQNRTDHPTADEIYLAVKDEIPNISLGTVYRNLNMLAEKNLIRKIQLEKFVRFDTTVENHYHLYCNSCNTISDLELPFNEDINSFAQKSFKGKITCHDVTFYGICEHCLNKNKF